MQPRPRPSDSSNLTPRGVGRRCSSRRSPRLRLAVVQLLTATALVAGPGIASAGAGVVSGTVTAGLSTLPGISVASFDGVSGVPGPATTTDGSGAFSLSLPDGVHLLRFSDPAGSFATEFHSGAATADAATPFTVTGGFTTIVDADLSPATGLFEGYVTDAWSSSRLNGIDVTVIDDTTGVVVGSTTTADDTTGDAGYFSVEVPADLPLLTRFSDPAGEYLTSFGAGATDVSTAGIISVTDGDVFSLPTGLTRDRARLFGSVFDDITGEPLEGVEVTLIDDLTGTVVGHTTTSHAIAPGRYEFEVPAGSYLVQFTDPSGLRLPQFLGGVTSLDLAAPLPLAPHDDLQRDVRLVRDRGWIQGVTRDPTLVGVGGIDVAVLDLDSGEVVATAQSSEDSSSVGSFEVEVASGDYVLRFTDPDGTYLSEFYRDAASADTALPITVVPGHSENVTIDLDAGAPPNLTYVDAEITGNVFGLDVAGNVTMMAGATVEVFDLTTGDLVGTATSDASGRFVGLMIPIDDSGTHVPFSAHVTPPSEDYLPMWWDAPAQAKGSMIGSPFFLRAGGSIDLLFYLNPAFAPIDGAISDPTTTPLAGVTVSAFDTGTGLEIPGTTVTTDGAGEFSMLAPAAYADQPASGVLLRFSDSGAHVPTWYGDGLSTQVMSDNAAIRLVTASGPVSISETLVEATATIVGVVRDALTGAPIDGVGVAVFDLATAERVIDAATGSDGSYELTVPATTLFGYSSPDRYALRVSDPSGVHESVWEGAVPRMTWADSIEAHAGGILGPHGPTPRTTRGTVKGTVSEDSTSPSAISGAAVGFYDVTTGELTGSAITDSAGDYEIELPEGQYLVRGIHSSYMPEWQVDSETLFGAVPVAVTARQLTSGVDLALAIPNAPPTVDAGADVAGDEGSPVALSATVSDPDGDLLTLTWSYTSGGDVDAGATCNFSASDQAATSITCDDDGTYTATLTADDGINEPASDDVTVTVDNVAPSAGVVTASTSDPVSVGTTVSLSMPYSDPGANDTHDASIDWGDGTTSPATATSGSVSGSHDYLSAGVYAVSVTVSDDDGGAATSLYEYVVVYDPDAGFVTGGGWYESPAGAYTPDPGLTGKANFGFVSKYKKGASVPTGKTEFQFRVADLTFRSTSYHWLVVTGPEAAIFKGVGTINDSGDYHFQIWAGDNDPDTFRIKIWEEAEGVEQVIYDNGQDQPINGGSILIHDGR